MSETDIKHRLATVEAPYNKLVWLDDVTFDSGMNLLRMTIREGRRITQIDLDQDTAARIANTMLAWSQTESPEGQA
jgi:hypothetical protein